MAGLNDNQFVKQQVPKEEEADYSQRAPWLRAAVLGATDGLISIASLMMGVGAVKKDVKAMILTGFAGLVAGACSIAIGEFVSVYSQLDVKLAQMDRDKRIKGDTANGEDRKNEVENLPNPVQAAVASALAFMVGAIVPLLSAAFLGDHTARLKVMVGAVSLALVVFGWVGAVMGRTSKSSLVLGCWLLDGYGHHFWANQVHWLLLMCNIVTKLYGY